YSEKELGSEKVGMFGFDDRDSMPFRKRLRAYIKGIESSLVLKQADVGHDYVFITSECEKGYEYSDHDMRYYTSYVDAYDDLRKRKNENSADGDDCKYEYRITIQPVGEIRKLYHIYDNDLRLVLADPVLPANDDMPIVDISEYFVYVPLPFKKGEIVKLKNRCTYSFCDDYAVFTFPDDETDERFIRMLNCHRQSGDYSDMYVSLTYFIPDKSHACGGAFWYDHFYVLDLDSCDESDLDKVEYGTKYLASAFDVNSGYDMWNLMLDYSHGDFVGEKVYYDADKYLRATIPQVD
ncbi:MAG: hypothetical protein K6F91_10705, partial [Ruminococcus sp.]|nr:hypothetical protein [Ruminococcus sp.]